MYIRLFFFDIFQGLPVFLTGDLFNKNYYLVYMKLKRRTGTSPTLYTICFCTLILFFFQNVIEETDHTKDTSLKVVKYASTPVMSTYLVAFVVGEFDFVEGKDTDGVTIRVYTQKGKAVQGQFALEVSLAGFFLIFSLDICMCTV